MGVLFPDSGLNAHNGTYTVSHPEAGHFTVKLYTARKGALEGRRILALLQGPDNTRDWKGVGFWSDDGTRVDVWKRFSSASRTLQIDGFNYGDHWSATEKKCAIWSDLIVRGATEFKHGHWYGEGYRLQLEGRCVVCNAVLTQPESIRLGIGPTCRGKQK
tara:strand:- start:2588 stop:3067 length:480 start_codon:yes stop_codon:yes gene_type:complete